jgi:hypothetical protein
MGLPHPLTLQRMKITWYGHAAFLIETEGIAFHRVQFKRTGNRNTTPH